MRAHPGETLRNVTKHTFTDAATGLQFAPGVQVTIPDNVHANDDLHVGDHLEGLSVALSAGILAKE